MKSQDWLTATEQGGEKAVRALNFAALSGSQEPKLGASAFTRKGRNHQKFGTGLFITACVHAHPQMMSIPAGTSLIIILHYLLASGIQPTGRRLSP